MRERLTGWGRTAPTVATVVPVRCYDDAVKAVTKAGPRGVLARGLGRSYGDAAQNAGGAVLDLTGLDRVHAVDADRRIVRCDAGVSLDALMQALLPFGLWLPVLPGTRQVTVGGAIAADVHGKNHHVVGSFGNHVVSFDLLTADGAVSTLTPESDLFWATVGGMGLTGVVLGATLALQAVETAYFIVDTERTDDLAGLMRRMAENDDDYAYSVAWFDAVATGKHLGRAVLTRGDPASCDDLPGRYRRAPLRFAAPRLATVPDVFPSGLLNRWTARAFNELWYRKTPVRRTGEIQDVTRFLHPLDTVTAWNRLYGRQGMCQYQFLVPFGAEPAFVQAVDLIARSGEVSCLNVLKRFGPANRSPLSFPAPGWTLTVDLPVTAGLDGLLRSLDALVLDAGGRLYLAKDSRLAPAAFAAMYPRLPEFEAIRARVDPAGVFRSDLSRRLSLGAHP